MKTLRRREFLRNSIIATSAVGLFPALGAATNGRVKGANGDIRCAVVGFAGRGMEHIQGLSQASGARIVALCDVDSNVLDKEVKKWKDKGQPVAGYRDLRKLLESKDIDAVSFATPNHWHSLGSIWAVQAGKDVYVEKPISHNVWEGRQLVNAASKYKRVVQAGTQARSSQGIREGIEYVQAGHLGKVLRARGLCYKRRPSIGKVDGPQEIPPTIDYDLWCGPAPKGPLMRKRLGYDWHWVWPTGNGDLGNQGVHQVDMCRWVLGETQVSPRVFSLGGRLGYVDDGTTPNTQIIYHDYAKAPLIFEVRGLPDKDGGKDMDKYHGVSIGVVVDCENGFLVIPDYKQSHILDRDGKLVKKFEGTTSHFENFIKAVRDQKPTELHAPIIEGHISAALCHTANISYRLGKTMAPEELQSAVKGNAAVAEALGRMEQHLGANLVDLHKTPATLGETLQMDPATEKFVGNAKADEMLTRDYRAPFVVPAIAPA